MLCYTAAQISKQLLPFKTTPPPYESR